MKIDATPFFQRKLKHLSKKYPHVGEDVTQFSTRLLEGELPGDQVPEVGYTVYKARIRNRDANKGKSGGYRIIYYLRSADGILLLTIYSKSDQPDISAEEIRQIIKDYEG